MAERASRAEQESGEERKGGRKVSVVWHSELKGERARGGIHSPKLAPPELIPCIDK